MTVLGIDPGLATVGFGVVESRSVKPVYTKHGVISTPAGLAFPKRLGQIYDDLTELITLFKPGAAAIEELFFNTNPKTAINVAQARGVLVLACERAGVPVFEYTPLQVKQAVTGYGRADKKQVMEMTRVLLSLEAIPKPDDAADALALAICHVHSAGSALSKL